MGKLAVGPIFQAGDGKPLNVDNLVRREIIPAISGTGVEWHDGHAFRRGLATTLHQLRVADKTIQAILRRSNVGITMNIYAKSAAESQVRATDALGAKMQSGPTCNDLVTKSKELIN
jgi:integrase